MGAPRPRRQSGHGLDAAATTIADRLNDTGALIDAARNAYERTDVANATNVGEA